MANWNMRGTAADIGMAGVPQGTSFADQQDRTVGTPGEKSGLHPADTKFHQALALKNFYSPIDPVRYAKQATIPNNSSKIMVVWGMGDIGPVTGPLTEGVSPDHQFLSQFRREIPVEYYGGSFLFTDEQMQTGKKEAFAYGAKACGKQAKLTEIQLCYAVMQGGTSAVYGGSASSTATVAAGDVITGDLLSTVLNTLIANFADMQTTVGKGSTNTDTLTTDAGYFMLAPFNMKTTFESLANTAGDKFVPVRKYAAHQKVEPGEIGSFKECRIILDTAMPIGAGEGAAAIDVYKPVIWGEGAFTMAHIGASTANIYSNGLGSSGSEDTLKQRATQGWKFVMGGGVLYEQHMVRLEVALS